MENYEEDAIAIELLEERLEMEAVAAGGSTADPDGFYCRCGWEQ